jgi:hypothetical protein
MAMTQGYSASSANWHWFRRNTGGDSQVVLDLSKRQDVGVLGVHVKQVQRVGRLVTIEDARFDDDDPKAIAGAVNH